MNDGHVGGEFRQKRGFLHGTVAASDDGDRLTPEKKPVTGRTRRNPMPEEPTFRVQAQEVCRCAGGNNQRSGVDRFFIIDGDGKRAAAEVDLGHVGRLKNRAEAFRLGTHVLNQLWPHDTLGKSGIILNVSR